MSAEDHQLDEDDDRIEVPCPAALRLKALANGDPDPRNAAMARLAELAYGAARREAA